MPAVGKVVALITRLGPGGVEVCVFEHPRGDLQLPAGTLHPGEDPIAGALREGFEETGLDRVIVRDRPIRFDDTRAIVHLALAGPAADEWWVFTPDGGGLCWRCFWLPIARRDRLHEWGRAWLDAALPSLANVAHHPAVRRALADPEVETDLVMEAFWAPPLPGDRAQITWLEPEHAPTDDEIGRSEVVAFTEDGLIVAQAEGEPPPHGMPGGRREPGESPEDTLRRELWEEACAEVLAFELIGYQRFRYIVDGDFEGVRSEAMYWARARCHDFVPRFETTVRALLTIGEARAEPWWRQPLTQRLLDRAVAAEQRARR